MCLPSLVGPIHWLSFAYKEGMEMVVSPYFYGELIIILNFGMHPRGGDGGETADALCVRRGVRGGAPAGCGAEPREAKFGIFRAI